MSATQTDFLTVTSHYIISWIDRHATHGSTYPCQLYVQDYSLSCSLKRFRHKNNCLQASKTRETY